MDGVAVGTGIGVGTRVGMGVGIGVRVRVGTGVAVGGGGGMTVAVAVGVSGKRGIGEPIGSTLRGSEGIAGSGVAGIGSGKRVGRSGVEAWNEGVGLGCWTGASVPEEHPIVRTTSDKTKANPRHRHWNRRLVVDFIRWLLPCHRKRRQRPGNPKIADGEFITGLLIGFAKSREVVHHGRAGNWVGKSGGWRYRRYRSEG